jgi:hypothetical protein
MKATLSTDSKLFHAEVLKRKLDNGGRLLIAITHTSRSNLSYRFKVWVAWDEEGVVRTENLGYWLASLTGQTLTDRHELKAGGLGFDRYLDVCLAIGHIFENCRLVPNGFAFGSAIRYTEVN